MSATPPIPTPHRWTGLDATTRGISHARLGLPNQDAVGIWPPGGSGEALILVVADGHGGAAYTRSHVGAAYAVRIARRLLVKETLPRFPTGQDAPDLPRLKRDCEEWLPKLLVRRWQDAVLRHARRYPLPGQNPAGDGQAEAAQRNGRLRHYGATLVAALLTPTLHLYLQLGDGDILLVGEDGEVSVPPLAADSRILANETTSLCGHQAWQDVRVHVQPILKDPPALVMLATDGYANSFVDYDAFTQVGGDLLAALVADGPAHVASHLPDWLHATSAAGSGDDISVALGWRSTVR